METAACKMTLQEKLNILADAAKYDVACTSSGSSRRGRRDILEMLSLPVSATVFPRTDAASLC